MIGNEKIVINRLLKKRLQRVTKIISSFILFHTSPKSVSRLRLVGESRSHTE